MALSTLQIDVSSTLNTAGVFRSAVEFPDGPEPEPWERVNAVFPRNLPVDFDLLVDGTIAVPFRSSALELAPFRFPEPIGGSALLISTSATSATDLLLTVEGSR